MHKNVQQQHELNFMHVHCNDLIILQLFCGWDIICWFELWRSARLAWITPGILWSNRCWKCTYMYLGFSNHGIKWWPYISSFPYQMHCLKCYDQMNQTMLADNKRCLLSTTLTLFRLAIMNALFINQSYRYYLRQNPPDIRVMWTKTYMYYQDY